MGKNLLKSFFGVAVLAMAAVNASAQDAIVLGEGNTFKGALEQGKAYTFSGEGADLVAADDFFYNTDYFTKNADGTFTFNAINGKYNITANATLNYFLIYPIDDEGNAGTFKNTGATWVCGNAGIGFPSFETNKNGWGESNGWVQTLAISISPAQIKEKVYQLTLTEGVQIKSGAEFKYYDAYNYNNDKDPDLLDDGLNSTDLLDIQSDLLSFNSGNNMVAAFAAGETYVLTLDRTGEKATLKVETLAEHQATGIQTIKAVSTDNAIYTLSGVRVKNITKAGIYIQNGKKIVIK